MTRWRRSRSAVTGDRDLMINSRERPLDLSTHGGEDRDGDNRNQGDHKRIFHQGLATLIPVKAQDRAGFKKFMLVHVNRAAHAAAYYCQLL